jgi:outer membrane protein assembly factor BamB
MRPLNVFWLCLAVIALPCARGREPWGNDFSHNMVLEAENLPVEFNEHNLIWEIGTGSRHAFPMPTIVGDKALVGSDLHGTPDLFWRRAANHGAAFTCYRLADGEQVWRLMVPQGGYGPGTYGMCGTPVIEGDRVYIQAMHELFCLDLDGLADGNDGMQDELAIMTRKPFKLPDGEEMPTEPPDWAADVIWHRSLLPFRITVQDATCCSPVVVGDQIWFSTANEIGSRSRRYNPEANKPHMVVVDKNTGELIAVDDMDVPIVFHGEWSSPSLMDVEGEKVVVFPDGYGVLHGLGIPDPDQDDELPVTIEEYWTYDLIPPEHRYLEDGREIVYTLDGRLKYKYPEGYYTDPERFFMFNGEEVAPPTTDHYRGLDPKLARMSDGDHPTVTGPCEIISMPTIVDNRIYVGIGRDRHYGLSRGQGRFVCLEMTNVRQAPRLVWEDREIPRTQSTASVADGLVYIADGKGMLNCYEADTGSVVYRYDLESKNIKERSQMLVDGKIYICTDQRDMKVLRAGREPELLASSKLREHTATIEAVDGLVLLSAARKLALYGDPEAIPVSSSD